MFPDQVEVGEAKERELLRRVFDDAAVPDLAIAEYAFDHVIRMFTPGPSLTHATVSLPIFLAELLPSGCLLRYTPFHAPRFKFLLLVASTMVPSLGPSGSYSMIE